MMRYTNRRLRLPLLAYPIGRKPATNSPFLTMLFRFGEGCILNNGQSELEKQSRYRQAFYISKKLTFTTVVKSKNSSEIELCVFCTVHSDIMLFSGGVWYSRV